MFDWLLSTDFASRASGGCSGWTLQSAVISSFLNACIAVAYLVIPFVLRSMIRRGFFPRSSIHNQVSVFVVVCGLGHALAAATNFVPLYNLAIVWDGVTALVSGYTAVFTALYAVGYVRRVNK